MEEIGQSLPDQIAERIAERILNGEFQPGSRLKEEQLSEQYGTSRAPIREAMYLLSLQGLVERVPRKGALVKSYTDIELTQLYHVRILLEDFALSQIDLPLSGHNHQRFANILDKMDEAVRNQNFYAYSQLNSAFHFTFFQLAGNQILENLYRQLEIPLQYILKLSVKNEETLARSFLEHRQIVSFMLQGNREEARALLKRHDAESLVRVTPYFEKSNK